MSDMRWGTRVGCAAIGAGLYVGVVTGRVTIDLGVGRRRQALRPLEIEIDAPRDLVFDVISAPYLGRTPKAMEAKLRVLQRGGDLVLAEHRTVARRGLTAVTLEMVRFLRPERVEFALVRGPVPALTEAFELSENTDRTRLRYSGELETDLWRAGQLWGGMVARDWTSAVEASLEVIRSEAERQASARRRSQAP
jgi:hypothetical protein